MINILLATVERLSDGNKVTLLSLLLASTAALSAKALRRYKRRLKWKLLWWKIRSAFKGSGSNMENAGMIFGGILITCVVFGLIFSWGFAALLFLILGGALLAGVSKGR